MVAEIVLEQPFPSVTVHVYVPGARPEAVAAVPPEGDQLYVNVPVPPVVVILALPVAPPLQLTLVIVPNEMTAAPKLLIEAVVDIVQPAASVTITVYVAAGSPDIVALVAALLQE